MCGAARLGRFGSLAPPQAVLGVLHDVYNTSVTYLNDTLTNLDPGCYAAPAGPALQSAARAYDWNTGGGAQVAAGNIDWATYRDELTAFMQGILQTRVACGQDPEPMQSWYVNTATPALANLTIAANVGQVASGVGTTVGAGAQGVADAIPWWVWAGGAAAVLLYLSTFVPHGGGRTAVAGYRPRRRRR